MSRTDFYNSNYGLPEKTWTWIQEQNNLRLLNNPICEICKVEKSTRVTGLGTLRACCERCNNNIYKQIDEDIELTQKVNHELGYTDEYGSYY